MTDHTKEPHDKTREQERRQNEARETVTPPDQSRGMNEQTAERARERANESTREELGTGRRERKTG